MSYELLAQHERTNQLTFPGPRPSMNVGRCVGIAGCQTVQVLVIILTVSPGFNNKNFINSLDHTSGILAAVVIRDRSSHGAKGLNTPVHWNHK